MTPPTVALMVVVPRPTAVIRPVASMVATVVLELVQLAFAVRFWVLPSVNVPVAVNCCVGRRAMEAKSGVTEMDTSSGGITLSTVEPVTPPTVALMVVVPAARAVASPSLPAPLLIVATVGAELAQVV